VGPRNKIILVYLTTLSQVSYIGLWYWMGGLIIITHHELGLDRPVSASSNSLFEGLPGRLLSLSFNSALFLESYCCSFLFHAVANLTCIFFVSRLLSTFPKFLHSFCGQKWCIRLFFWKKFISTDINHIFILFSKGPNFAVI